MRKQKTPLILSIFLIIGFGGFNANAGWWPFSKSNEKTPVHAYFYYSSGQESYLGRFTGATACQSAAYHYASSKNVESTNWDYICCTIEKGSDCYRKIRW